MLHVTFRGTSESRSSVGRHTRVRTRSRTAQAAHLWRELGEYAVTLCTPARMIKSMYSRGGSRE